MSEVVLFFGCLFVAWPAIYAMDKAGISRPGFSYLRVLLAASVVVGVGLIAWAVGQR